jgi:hypothetical protein
MDGEIGDEEPLLREVYFRRSLEDAGGGVVSSLETRDSRHSISSCHSLNAPQ